MLFVLQFDVLCSALQNKPHQAPLTCLLPDGKAIWCKNSTVCLNDYNVCVILDGEHLLVKAPPRLISSGIFSLKCLLDSLIRKHFARSQPHFTLNSSLNVCIRKKPESVEDTRDQSILFSRLYKPRSSSELQYFFSQGSLEFNRNLLSVIWQVWNIYCS